MSCYQQITCPKCNSKQVVKAGKSISGVQQYSCQNQECITKTFMQKYRYKAYEPRIKKQVIEMFKEAEKLGLNSDEISFYRAFIQNEFLLKKRVIAELLAEFLAEIEEIQAIF